MLVGPVTQLPLMLSLFVFRVASMGSQRSLSCPLRSPNNLVKAGLPDIDDILDFTYDLLAFNLVCCSLSGSCG